MVHTDRLELRPPVEADRSTFVDWFQDEDFMMFSGGTLSESDAHARFDVMLRTAGDVDFAKQPVVERSSSRIIGYCGVAWFEFDGDRRLEFGYRLVTDARGAGYATEAGRALLGLASRSFRGELLAMIDPTNAPSKAVARKLGFEYWKTAVVDGYLDEIHRLRVGRDVSS